MRVNIIEPTSTTLTKAIRLPMTNDLFSKHFIASKAMKMSAELITKGKGK